MQAPAFLAAAAAVAIALSPAPSSAIDCRQVLATDAHQPGDVTQSRTTRRNIAATGCELQRRINAAPAPAEQFVRIHDEAYIYSFWHNFFFGRSH